MAIYFFVLAMIFVLAAFSSIYKKKVVAYDYLIIIILTIFSGIRYYVGTDYELYYRLYNNIANVGPIEAISKNNVEIGYSYLNYITYKLFENQYAIFITTSLIIISITILFIKRNSNNYMVSIVFYYCFSFFTNSMNIQRQYIATSCLLVATYFFKKNKILRTGICLLLAFLFHRTSIIILIAYLLIDRIKINYKTINMLLVIGICGAVSYSSIIQLIARFVVKYTLYEEKSYEAGIGSMLTVAIFLTICIITVILEKKNILKDDLKIYVKILILGIPFYIVSLKSFLIMRISMVYFGIYSIVIIPEIFKLVGSKLRLNLYYYYYIIMMGWFYLYLITQNGVIPYRTIFSTV